MIAQVKIDKIDDGVGFGLVIDGIVSNNRFCGGVYVADLSGLTVLCDDM